MKMPRKDTGSRGETLAELKGENANGEEERIHVGRVGRWKGSGRAERTCGMLH